MSIRPFRGVSVERGNRSFEPPVVRADRVDLFFGLLIGFLLVGSGALMIADGEAAMGGLVVAMGLALVAATVVQRLRR